MVRRIFVCDQAKPHILILKCATISESFDELMTKVFSVNYVKFDESNWKLSICSCAWLAKHFKCYHVIEMAVRKGLAEYPETAQIIPLDQKRKRKTSE